MLVPRTNSIQGSSAPRIGTGAEVEQGTDHHPEAEMALQAEHIEQIGDFLAIRWNDGSESAAPLEDLRRNCPCARCAGEPDVTGAIRMPAQQMEFVPESFELRGFERVGLYAVALTWGDGHNTGIYNWPLLQRLGN
jgi:DUF971 family protein